MKRRGFFGAFAGLIAAPVAGAALKSELDLPVVTNPPMPCPLPEWPEVKYIAFTATCTPWATVSDSLDEMHKITRCKFCGGREFSHYRNCRHCGASM